MTDPKHDHDLLAGHFSRYRAELAAAVTPAGPAAVRRTVRGRRRFTVAAAVTAAATLVAGPVAGYAALSDGPGPVPPSPAPIDSVSPSAAPPSVSPSPPASASAGQPTGGRITKADLLQATVDLPAWRDDAPCEHSGARLTDAGRRDGDNWLTTVVSGDVNADGDQEAITIIRCVYLQTGQSQVVVFDRDGTGAIVTLGRVVATDRIIEVFSPAKIGWIAAVEPGPDGRVRVQVGDVEPCCGWPSQQTQRQWRTYALRGNAFQQTGGPSVFGANKYFVDLRVTVDAVVFERGTSGAWSGTIIVKVRNKGPYRPENASLSLSFGGARVGAGSGGWTVCQNDVPSGYPPPDQALTCTLPVPLRPEEERTLVLDLITPSKPSTTGTAEVSRHDSNGYVPDPTPADNTAQFSVR